MQQRAAPPRMNPGRRLETRQHKGVAQARAGHAAHAPRALVLLATMLLPACVGSPAEGPFEFYRQLTGEALEGRQMPPGLGARSPNLSVVPARPERGPAGVRADLSATLAANRAAAANPAPVGAPVPDRPATEGGAVVPAAPPPPPRIVPAPPIGAGPATLLVPGAASGAQPAAPSMPSAPPAPPPAELLAPPPPDLSGPPPPPRGL
ncbi:hypothetical protein [Muricoccus radiodurans]|uniref:hypothetical protein n=1 Tax=Muricoccus radiodurans TaxID=2231721 RepID=UPI003CEB4B09